MCRYGGIEKQEKREKRAPTSGWDKTKIFIKTLGNCMLQSIPAPLAWLMVGLLRGEHVTCAMWPTQQEDYPVCAGDDSAFPLPCQIPKTYETEVESCAAVMAKLSTELY